MPSGAICAHLESPLQPLNDEYLRLWNDPWAVRVGEVHNATGASRERCVFAVGVEVVTTFTTLGKTRGFIVSLEHQWRSRRRHCLGPPAPGAARGPGPHSSRPPASLLTGLCNTAPLRDRESASNGNADSS